MSDIAAKVLGVLAPPPRKGRDGMMVTSEAYYNLEGALYDLHRQKADPICIRTIERVQKQIVSVLKICEAATASKEPVRSRSQIKNHRTGTWSKRDDKSGKFMDVKVDSKPFTGKRKKKRK